MTTELTQTTTTKKSVTKSSAKKTPVKATTTKKSATKSSAKKTPAKATVTKKSNPETASSASSQSVAITVSSSENSLSAALAPALSHPASVAISSTFLATVEGFNKIWTHEAEYKTGLQFATLCKDAFVALVLPILNLLWLTVATAYRFSQKPETTAWLSAQNQRVSSWTTSVLSFANRSGDEDEQLNLDVDSQ